MSMYALAQQISVSCIGTRRLASAFRVSDMYMKEMVRGLALSYLSPRDLPSSCRNNCQLLVAMFHVLCLSNNLAFRRHRTSDKGRLPSQLWIKQKIKSVVFYVLYSLAKFPLFFHFAIVRATPAATAAVAPTDTTARQLS